MYLTLKQNATWKDSVTLFEHNLKFRSTARLHLNLGNAYSGQGRFDEAIVELNKANQIADLPQTHFNLGIIYNRQGKKELAREEYIKTFQIDHDYFYVYSHLIDSFIETKEYDKALPFLERLTRVYPNDLKLTLLYGKLLFVAGQTDKAEIQFKKSLEISNNMEDVKDKIDQIKNGQEIF